MSQLLSVFEMQFIKKMKGMNKTAERFHKVVGNYTNAAPFCVLESWRRN